MRYVLMLVLCIPLQGCFFFFYVPGSSQAGNACASEYSQVGQLLRNEEGKVGKIEKVIGRHQRCPTAARPILVEVSYEQAGGI